MSSIPGNDNSLNKTAVLSRGWTWASIAFVLVFLAVPLVGLLSEVGWTDIDDHLRSDAFVSALRTTSIVVPISTGVVVVAGTPLAWSLARDEVPFPRLVRSLLFVPIVLPPVVSGLVLLSAFGRSGMLGSALDSIGVSLPFTTAGAVVAAVFVSVPFYVIAAEQGFRSVPQTSFDAARLLGVTRSAELLKVAIPAAIKPIGAGAALAAARAIGEFGATITFAGSLEGRTATLPLATFSALQTDPALARTIGLVLIVVAAAIVFLLRGSLNRPSS